MNILTDPLLTTDPLGPLTLPGLLAASARNEVRGFPRLRAHQRAAWHMFRVQLAALALRAAGLTELSEDEATWAALLRTLTPGDLGDDPWRLAVPDRARPAFLQPPDPGGLKWTDVPTPDALDLLITARNHDLKVAVAGRASPEDWLYALVSLQTSEGYGGAGRYGIARMNGGSSSRPFLGLAPASPGGAPDPSAWWRRDLAVLLRSQSDETVLVRGGHALLWCLPWPEGRAIPAQDMDPWAIELCRRIRLSGRNGRISAERAGSKASRVEARTFAGVLDDPWAPVKVDEDTPKALTLSEGRFDYRRIVDLMLTGAWRRPIAAQLSEGETAGDMVLVAEALSRGNSKTDGFKSRIVPMPRSVNGLFATAPDRISTAAKAQMDEIGHADAALREAVALYAAGGNREKVGKPHRLRAARARARLDAAADRLFFPCLWARALAMAGTRAEEDAAAFAFRAALVRAARAELRGAFRAVPCPAIHAPRAETRAWDKLNGLLRHHRLTEETPADG